MTVYKSINRNGKNGNGFGRTVSWSAIIGGKAVHGFATKRQALDAVAAA